MICAYHMEFFQTAARRSKRGYGASCTGATTSGRQYRDIDTILQKLSSGFRIELSIGQYIWKPENESQWHGSDDSARITLEISADGIATAKVTNPGDFRAYGTDHGRINKVGIVSIHPL